MCARVPNQELPNGQNYFQALHQIQEQVKQLSNEVKALNKEVICQRGYFEGKTQVSHTQSTESIAQFQSLQSFTTIQFENFNLFGKKVVKQLDEVRESVAALNDVCFSNMPENIPQEGGHSNGDDGAEHSKKQRTG